MIRIPFIGLLLCCALGAATAAPPGAVLQHPPGQGVAFGAEFPQYTLDQFGHRFLNLTTPYAAQEFGRLVQKVDLPLRGQPIGSPVYIVDNLKENAPGRTVTAGCTGAIVVDRRYLEQMVGIRIDPKDPRSVDLLVRRAMDNPRFRNEFTSIAGHELGHLTQEHGVFEPRTRYSRMARLQRDRLRTMMDRGSWEEFRQGLVNELLLRPVKPDFQKRLDAATSEYHKQFPAHQGDRVNPQTTAVSISSHIDEYLADQHAVTTTFLSEGNLRMSLGYWTNPGGGGNREWTTAKRLAAVEYIRSNPQVFAGKLERPVKIMIQPDLPQVIVSSQGGQIQVSGLDAVQARLTPMEASISETYRRTRSYEPAGKRFLYGFEKTGTISGAFAEMNAPGPRLVDSHPSDVARVLNLAKHVEAHPEIFAKGLDQPVRLRVVRNVPALEFTRVGNRIVVKGIDALRARLPAPEGMLFDRFQDAKVRYQARVDSPLNRLRLRPYRALEPHLVKAAGPHPEPPPGPRWVGGGVTGIRQSLSNDWAKGGIYTMPLIAAASGTIARITAGEAFPDALRNGVRGLMNGQFAASLVAGSLGAALGAAIPLPGALAATRFLGPLAGTIAGMAGAMVAAQLAGNAVLLHQEGRLSAGSLFGSVDWFGTLGQILGASTLLTLTRGLAPRLALGPIAIVPLLAGIGGATLGERAVAAVRSDRRTGQLPDGGDPLSDLPRSAR
jgi:hypothetical protein